jgi:hypothetical protein
MLRKPERLAHRRAASGSVSNQSAPLQEPYTVGRYRNTTGVH